MAKGRHHNQKTGKFWTFSKIGGKKQQQISLKFKFGLLKTDGGGVGIFQKSLNFKYFDHMGL